MQKLFNYNVFTLIAISVLLFFTSSCSKMNDLQDKYLKNGETIYVGRLDTASIQAGKNRVLLHYVSKDPKAANLFIYWRSKTDSVVLNIPANGQNDTISVFIDNLPEDTHTFQFVTANKDLKYRSMAYEINANVYGERFQSSLINRLVGSKEFLSATGQLTIKWLRAPQYAIATEVTYKDILGQQKKVTIPVATSDTQINDVAGEISYRTSFLPEKNAVDTFYTEPVPLSPVVIAGGPLDKSKFKRWNPPGIPYNAYTTSNWWIENAWNNNLTTGFANYSLEFTFDIGQVAKLSRLIINTRSETDLIYNHQHPRKFQLWGSDHADVTNDFAGWKLLGTFESIKPSGSPLGTVTAADIQYANVIGEKYNISADQPPMRYIRFVCQETWGKLVGLQFMEMTLWGTPVL